MEVDEIAGTVPPGPSATTSSEMEAAIAGLGEVLAELETKPQNVPLLQKQIRLMQQLGMTAEVMEGIARLSQLVMLNENLWLGYFDALIPPSGETLTLDQFVEILEKFDQAEQDYLSPAILLRHIEFILLCSRSAFPLPALEDGMDDASNRLGVDEEVQAFLTEETTRGMLQGVCQRAQGLLSESHLVWQPWLEWELGWLERISDDQRKKTQIEQIHAMFLERMTVPHSTMDATSSAYSTFCSEHSPNDYEQRMIKATEISQPAKTKLSLERRYQQTREDLEQQIMYNPDPATQAQVFLTYINWETDLKAKNTKQTSDKRPSSDPALIRSVFERAVSAYARAATAAEIAVVAAEISLKAAEEAIPDKGKGKKGKARAKEVEKEAEQEASLAARREEKRVALETVRAYKEAEAVVWARYATWLNDAEDEAMGVRVRATRACPQSSSAWTNLLTSMEQNGAPLEDLTGTFEKAISLGLLTSLDGPVSNLVDVFISRAAFENRVEPAEEVEGDYHPVMATLMRGIDLVTEISKIGDPSLRLEKFMVDWAETRGTHFLQQAMSVLDKPHKARQASYQIILLRTGVETRRGNIEQAREIFDKAIQRSDLDWPEAIFEAFIQFENVHGDLETVLDAKKRIEKEQEKLTRRREKIAQEQMAAQVEAAQAYQDQMMIAAGGQQVDNGAVVDVSEVTAAPPAAPVIPAAASVEGGESHVKRDREHCTVLVTGLPKGIDIPKVEAIFSTSGNVRETVIISGQDRSSDAALVEFRHAESVPAALTRDQDEVDDHVISVSLLWRSTLFVTNFPREMDDTALRAMFAEYGGVLQTRWPSRKYADNRRFCYVTMDSPASAESALALNGKQQGGFGMTVLISDPSAKTKRSDAVQSTLFVGGLTSRTTEEDVDTLFKSYGNIKNIKLGWDPVKKLCKGFAFVEMSTEDEAKASLALSGTSVNGKFLKVSISDPNHASKKAEGSTGNNAASKIAAERRTRSVRLHNIPEGSQEGLLQQALEKIIPVKRLEMFANTHQALVELESVADVGKLLLKTEPFIFNGTTILITQQNDMRKPPIPKSASTNTTPAQPTPTPTPTSSLSFAPRTSRKPGKQLGKGRTAPAVDKVLATAAPKFVAASKGGGVKDQDDFRTLVNVKNEQRVGNLMAKLGGGGGGSEKRGLEENGVDEREKKKSKVEDV